MNILFHPLTALYEMVIRLRWQLYASGFLQVSRLKKPVISVGNLTMGGTGKTPTTIALAQLLHESGQRVAILLRGYRGQHRGKPLLVSDGQRILTSAKMAGDEALVLAENVPQAIVAVGRSRAEVGAFVEQQFDVDVHLLDDGFQHLSLHRDLNLLVIDVTNPFDRGLPPLGRLREPLDAISRADAIIFTRAESSAECHPVQAELQKIKPAIRCFIARQNLISARILEGPGDMRGKHGQEKDRSGACIETLRGLKGLAFAGIGNPAQFFRLLRQHEVQLLDTLSFADHHEYTPASYHQLRSRGQSLGVNTLITTEKDAVKLDADSVSPLRILVVKVSFEFDDVEALRQLLSETVRRAAQ